MKLPLKVVPGASRDGIQWLDEAQTILKVRVTAAPEKGKANKAVTALIAAHLGLPKAAVTLVSGNTSQQKLVEISGMPEAEISQRLS